MAHPIIEGHVTVLKVVSPGSYWIKCENCRGTCRIPESIRRKLFPNDFYPSNGTKVFVHDADGFFYHGTVCGRGKLPIFSSMQACKYAVQLTHTFQVKDFDRCHIYPTFEEESVACESAHLVSLYRVLPQFPPPEFGSSRESDKLESCQSFENSVMNWDHSNSIVEDLIQKRRKFRYEQLAVINGSVYGKLSFFETAGYVNIKDFLASQKIVVRVTFRFDVVVQSLMSRPLYKCYNLLPVYNPYCAPDPQVIPETHHDSDKRDYYDVSKFRVHEQDIALHESMWTPTSLNILFTGLYKPYKKEITVRYVAPDGEVVLGTVLSPNVAIWEQCGIDEPPENMLTKYLREKALLIPQRVDSCMLYDMDREMPPSSDDEDDSVFSHDDTLHLFGYDFEEALSKFRGQGGLLEDYSSLNTLLPAYSTVLGFVQDSFDYLGIPTLEDWQRVCLPSIVSKKNVLVIGPESHRKMTSSIVSTLSLMRATSTDRTQQNSSVSPTLVLFVHDCKRANQAAKLCQSLSNLKVITSTYSQISEVQKQEAQKGCDVLISTPSNWLKFTRDLKCFDCCRLTHVVFDSFERLRKDYPSDIETIFQDIRSTDQVQTILLSNVWGPFLVDFVKLLGSTTRCVIDLVQACFCYRLEPTVVIASDDWDELLVSIIQDDQTTLRLLLCHDDLEVATIKSRTNHLGSVLYADENEDRQFALESINQWKSNEKTFLVSSDVLFNELDFAQNVNLLVSWKLNSCSRLTLIQRFMSIRAHAPQERRKVPVYIFCGQNNLEELQFIKQILENVKYPRFLGGDIDECIESTFKDRENRKMGKHCLSLIMFGKCDLTPLCPYRHNFRQQDLVHVVQNNVFLKITLLKFHSAFHSTVRVEDVISNQEISDTVVHSFSSKLSEIEAGLELAFENHANESHDSELNMVVDDVVGACIKEGNRNILKRVKILSIGEKIEGEAIEYEVLSMDFDEPPEIFSSNDLFPLPPKIVAFPRDIVDVFLSKLVPTDFKSNWTFETKSLLNNYAELLSKNVSNSHHELLAGVIEVVIGRSILVNSIQWCRTEDQNMYVVGGSVKELILASKYVKSNSEHFDILSKLAVDCGKQPFVDIVEEEFGYRRKLPAGFNGGVVSAFDDPGLFYVQLDAEKQSLQEFEKRLTASLNKCRRRLSVVNEDEMCCVQIDGLWNRALILETAIENESDSNTKVAILCVDYGDVHLSIDVRQLFCLPNEFIEGVPYFAIECELVGILPFEGQWNKNVVAEFEKHIRNSEDQVTPVNVKFCGVVEENRYTKGFRHQVALRGPDGAESTINQILVSRGIASWNEATVDLLMIRDEQPRRNTQRSKKAVRIESFTPFPDNLGDIAGRNKIVG